MADSFTKLFGTILASTVWQEPDSTRLTWITMLAMADRDGLVAASVPGLAHMARVSVPQVEAALATFMSPDPYSRTPDNDGRRIEQVPGGWRLLNHALYRQRQDSEARKERKRQWDRENRPSGHARAKAGSPTQSDECGQNRHITEADTEAEALKAEKHVHPAAPAARMPAVDQLGGDRPVPEVPARIRGEKPRQTATEFPRFWAAYPVKKGKAAAMRSWKAKGCDAIANEIIAHVRKMEREDRAWVDGFIPHGSTYINGERWTDEPEKKQQGAAKSEPSGAMPPAAQVLQQGESKLEAALGYIRQRYHRGDFGEGQEAEAERDRLLREATERHRRASDEG
jgi:hypothetical protein